MKKTVYIASPFFNPSQIERVEFIKKALDSLGIVYYSPKDEAVVEPSGTKSWREEVFKMNCSAIENAVCVIAVTDGKDVGTMFEAGYAYRANKPILYFCETLALDQQFNLMLAESGVCACRTREDLVNYLMYLKETNFESYPVLKYKGAIE